MRDYIARVKELLAVLSHEAKLIKGEDISKAFLEGMRHDVKIKVMEHSDI